MAIPELQDTSGRLTDCIYFGDPISSNIGSGFVPTNRMLATTLPLTGGGDLSANRTFAINNFAGSVAGAVPPSTGGVVTFLRADGSWATPPTFGAATVGYAPASGGGAVNYLRADGTWAAPAGSTIAGLTIGFIPVADSATSIVDSRVEQGADWFKLTTEDDLAGTASGLSIADDGSYLRLRPFQTAPFPSVGTRGLFLCDSTGYAGGSGISIAGSNVTFNSLGSEGLLKHYGQWALPLYDLALSNGYNNGSTLLVTKANNRITGPTAAFSIGGMLGGTESGTWCVLYNSTTQPMTILDEDLLSLDSTRFRTLTGGNVVLSGNGSVATFLYDTVEYRWVMVYTNPAVQYPRTLGYVPYENSDGDLADSTLFHDSANNRYGFATVTPYATVDINGTLATRSYNQALSNGLNSDLAAPTTSYMRITGPTGAFSVGGVTIVTGDNGKRLTIHNTTAQAMTIVHEDGSSTAANRINTLTAANVVFPARQSVVHLVYSTTTSRWILDEANPVTAGGATTQVQHNLAGALSGDTGLVVAGTGTAKTLTLGTDVTFARKATRHLELGTPNAAPSNYTLAGNSAIGGTDSNKTGGALRVGGGAGTGENPGGDTVLVTGNPGSFGNTQNVLVDRMVYVAKPATLISGVATDVCIVGVPTETGSGGTLYYTIYATDGTDMQTRRGRLPWGAVNKAGTITIVLGTPEEVDCTPTGTLTVTITAVDNGNDTFTFQFDAASSLTETILQSWIALQHDGYGAVTTV